MKSTLPTAIVIERCEMQLREWEIAKLDASIAYDVHVDLGSSKEIIEKLSARVIECEKAIRVLAKRLDGLKNPTEYIAAEKP